MVGVLRNANDPILLPQTLNRQRGQNLAERDAFRTGVQDDTPPEPFPRRLCECSQSLEIMGMDGRTRLDLDTHQISGAVFEDDIHFLTGLGPKMEHLRLNATPGDLLLDRKSVV